MSSVANHSPLAAEAADSPLPRSLTVAVIAGDGIGPEVIRAALPAIDRAAATVDVSIHWDHLPYGADHYLKTGETLPDAAVEELRGNVDAIFVGALGDPRIPDHVHARDILLGLRFKLDLFVNFRPIRLLHPSVCALRPRDGGRTIDFVVFRENTEGSYLGRGSSRAVGTPDEEQISEEIHSAPKVSRILRAAFAWARAHGRRRVTMTDKANAIPAHRLWQRLFEAVGNEFPDVEREHRYIDALAMELVREPERFEVVVANNVYGDILSDLGAGLVGGLGLAASANLHPGHPGLFEPVHGSAPPLAGRGVANPMAAILTGGLLLAEAGLPEAADRLERAVRAALSAGITTSDLGGDRSTDDVAAWVAAAVEST